MADRYKVISNESWKFEFFEDHASFYINNLEIKVLFKKDRFATFYMYYDITISFHEIGTFYGKDLGMTKKNILKMFLNVLAKDTLAGGYQYRILCDYICCEDEKWVKKYGL